MMNGIIKKSINNFKYVFIAQFIVLLFGFLKSLIVPGFLDVKNFGYWQIYLLYSSYAGIFALGFNDGIYLRYGSYQYEEIPYKKLRTAIRINIIVLLFFSVVAGVFTGFANDLQRQFALRFVSANIFVLGVYGVFIIVLQITNQMKRFSFFLILDKVIVMVAIVVGALTNIDNFEYLVVIDLLSKIVVLIGMIVYCKELFIGENCKKVEAINEYKTNVSVGIKLMLAQFMGILVTGIGRIVVECLGNIEEYAYYSFGVTITNLVLVLITSVSLIIYPMLKRLNEENYPRYYERINCLLQKFNLLIPLGYFISFILITILLPQYASVLIYLNILFGVIIMQAKVQLLNNTFYKVLRKETAMMTANIVFVVIYAIVSVSLFLITKSIWCIALCTLLTMAWLCFASEVYLRKAMHIQNYKGIILEFIYIIGFIFITTTFTLNVSLMFYVCFLLINVCKYWHDIIGLIKNIKSGEVK